MLVNLSMTPHITYTCGGVCRETMLSCHVKLQLAFAAEFAHSCSAGLYSLNFFNGKSINEALLIMGMKEDY